MNSRSEFVRGGASGCSCNRESRSVRASRQPALCGLSRLQEQPLAPARDERYALTRRTLRGAARQMASAETRLHRMAMEKAGA